MKTPFLVLALVCVVSCESEEAIRTEGPIQFPPAWAFSSDAVPVTAKEGMVASASELASKVGIDVLRSGRNAVDAAVATHFALAVVYPQAGNIGGGGFMVARMADSTLAALDFREKAPLAATRDMFLDDQGNSTDKSLLGHLAVGVPGSVLGMWEAHQRFGTLPWADLLQPAITLAEKGFEITIDLRGYLERSEDRLRLFKPSAEIFLSGSRLPEVGDILRQPDLAATLQRIAQEGPDGFYRGKTAELLVAEMERGGGIITLEDLERYTAKWREPVIFDYRGYTIISMPPPASGGATIAEIANILEGYDLAAMGFHSPQSIHLFVEAAKRGFADRNTHLADPDFIAVPLERMISEEYATQRRATIDAGRVTPASEILPGLSSNQAESYNTTHYSVADAIGNAVSVTTTLNAFFGSKVTVQGGGFLLNNEMDDFAAKPGSPNVFGLVQGEANAVAPGKRMLSSMSPTIVLDPQGRLFLLTGTGGGPTIITTVYQTISNIIDFRMNVAQAVSAPRLHHQHLPDHISFEHEGLTPEAVAALEALGHSLTESWGSNRYSYWGDVQAIMVMPDGTLQGASDPRRAGKAIGY